MSFGVLQPAKMMAKNAIERNNLIFILLKLCCLKAYLLKYKVMKKIKIISKIAEIYHHRHHFWNIPYIMKQEKHIIDSINPHFF